MVVICHLITVVVHSACLDGEFEQVPNSEYCRYKYKGIYSYGNQRDGEFGTGGLIRPITPVIVPRNDTEIVEEYVYGYVKTKNYLFRAAHSDPAPKIWPIITVPMNFSIVGLYTIFLSNNSLYKIIDFATIAPISVQPPVKCIDVAALIGDEYLCLTSELVVYHFSNSTQSWAAYQNFTSAIPSTTPRNNLKFVKKQLQHLRRYGIICDGVVYTTGTMYNSKTEDTILTI
jgi:hypothetical protein